MSTTAPRPGVIVLEGADASGKTTLARYLCRHYGARYLHNGPYRDPWRWHLGCYLLAERWVRQGHLVVVDRHWLSELIYGSAYRAGGQYPIAARCLDRLWLRLGALNVLCVPTSRQAQLDRHWGLRQRRDEYVTDIAPVVDEYRWMATMPPPTVVRGQRLRGDYRDVLRRPNLPPVPATRLDWVVYDLDCHGGELRDWCDWALFDRLPAHQPMRLLTPNSVGGYATTQGRRFLIIGLQPSPQAHTRYPFPFVDRCTNPSAVTYLNRALHVAGINEGRLRWVNACDRDGYEAVNLRMEINYARRYGAAVLVLGRQVEEHVRKIDPHYCVINDPGYERRFNYQDPPTDYARQLEEIIHEPIN